MIDLERSGGGLVRISDAVIEVFEKHRQTRDEHEAGGILLGRLISGTGDVVIDEASRPDASDRRSRFRFFRARRSAQKLVDDRWTASQGTNNYLGEWHTHPEDVPNPSTEDLKNWQTIVGRARFEQTHLVFVIVGSVETRAWELTRGGNPEELQHKVPAIKSTAR